MSTKFEVRTHPHSKKHLLLVVTTARGLVYASASAWEEHYNTPKPTPDTVRYTWKHGRHFFLPYNESTGTFTQEVKK